MCRLSSSASRRGHTFASGSNSGLTATQTFIWLADGSATLDSLVAAIPTRFDRLPAVSSLFGSGSGASLAQRLCAYAPEPNMRQQLTSGLAALKTGRSIVVSCNLPESMQVLRLQSCRLACSSLSATHSQATAEQHLIALLAATPATAGGHG